MDTIQVGDLVQLISKDDKRFIIRVQASRQLHTHRGIVDHDALVGQTWGTEIKSHLGQPFLLLQPSIHDLIMNIKRTTQIVYPKESAHILLKMSIGPGKRVIEAGTGSGALTIAMAHAIGPTGRIYSYEERPEMSQAARANLERLGFDDRVELKVRDIAQGFDERGVDALFLDVREPWVYLEQVREALATGGFFGSLVPTTNQIQALIWHMKRYRFMDIEVIELLERHYKPVPGRLRPEDRLTAHTGYLIFGRNTSLPVIDIEQAQQADEEADQLRRGIQDEAPPRERGKPLPLP